MARSASVAIAGFYPTNQAIIQHLHKNVVLIPPKLNRHEHVVLDPCAGDGRIQDLFRNSARYIMVEMENARLQGIKEDTYAVRKIHADIFCVSGTDPVASILWLNPPYDADRRCVRLEEKFLRHTTPMLAPDGSLFFVVPYYALAASAETLSSSYSSFRCWKFPDPHFNVFKQVILHAYRKNGGSPDSYDMIREWSKNPDSIPTLGDEKIYVNGGVEYRWSGLRVSSVDAEALSLIKSPWANKGRALPSTSPPRDIQSVFRKTWDVVNVPKETHIISALSVGALNGVRITPNEPGVGLPDLLLKGVMRKRLVQVDSKTNADGEETAKIMVEKASVDVCALRLDTYDYFPIKTPGEIRVLESADDLASANLATLIDLYGLSIMSGMLQSCPPLHDPRRDDEFDVELPRPLFKVQKTAVNSLVKMRETWGRRGAILLGEVGSGKTSVALAFAKKIEAKRALIMCPPHLLESWASELAVVRPEAKVVIIDSITTAREFSWSEGPVFGILSREKAKLGSTVVGVSGGRCPRCGHHTSMKQETLAAKRARCQGQSMTPKDKLSGWFLRNHLLFWDHIKGSPIGNAILSCKSHRVVKWLNAEDRVLDMEEYTSDTFRPIVPILSTNFPLLFQLCWAYPQLTEAAVSAYKSVKDYDVDQLKLLLTLLPPGTEVTVNHGLKWSSPKNSYYSYGICNLTTDEARWVTARDVFWGVLANPTPVNTVYFGTATDGKINGTRLGSDGAKDEFLRLLLAAVSFTPSGKVCNEPMYQYTAEPRRYPIANWISRYAKHSYDLLILDEAHELASEGSAQTIARTRLQSARAFTLALTGSLMNGYASSIFENLYSVSGSFAAEYTRDDGREKFCDHYGFRKVVIEVDPNASQKIDYGSRSDRVVGARKMGQAPGLHPNCSLEHILQNSVVMLKSDLDVELHDVEYVTNTSKPTQEQQRQYDVLQKALFRQILADRRDPDLSGKLWGAMMHLSSFPDRCFQPFDIHYPKSVGGALVVSEPGLDPSIILPKEEALIRSLHEELAEGRNVIVLAWHRDVVERLQSILGPIFGSVVLDSEKVPTSKRQSWINKNIVKPGVRVMVTNPKVIQTGLNNLVHFATQAWFENPGCDPIIFLQAVGRIDRIGQEKSPRVITFTYEMLIQEEAKKLLLHKVGISKAVGGLDPEAILREAGVESEMVVGMGVGRQLYKLIVDGLHIAH